MRLLGSHGERWLELIGVNNINNDTIIKLWMKGDYEPCDACKEKYVGIIVMDSHTRVHKHVYQVFKEYFMKLPMFHPHQKYWAARQGKCFITKSQADKIGLLDVHRNISDRNKDD